MSKLCVFLSALVVFVLCVGCKRYSDKAGEYRISSDGNAEIYYLKDRLAFSRLKNARGGRLAISRAVGTDTKASTGDQIDRVLVDHISSINFDKRSGLIYGEQDLGNGPRYFALKDFAVEIFADALSFENYLMRHAVSGVLFPEAMFIDSLKLVSRSPGKQ